MNITKISVSKNDAYRGEKSIHTSHRRKRKKRNGGRKDVRKPFSFGNWRFRYQKCVSRGTPPHRKFYQSTIKTSNGLHISHGSTQTCRRWKKMTPTSKNVHSAASIIYQDNILSIFKGKQSENCHVLHLFIPTIRRKGEGGRTEREKIQKTDRESACLCIFSMRRKTGRKQRREREREEQTFTSSIREEVQVGKSLEQPTKSHVSRSTEQRYA